MDRDFKEIRMFKKNEARPLSVKSKEHLASKHCDCFGRRVTIASPIKRLVE